MKHWPKLLTLICKRGKRGSRQRAALLRNAIIMIKEIARAATSTRTVNNTQIKLKLYNKDVSLMFRSWLQHCPTYALISWTNIYIFDDMDAPKWATHTTRATRIRLNSNEGTERSTLGLWILYATTVVNIFLISLFYFFFVLMLKASNVTTQLSSSVFKAQLAGKNIFRCPYTGKL